MKCRDRALVDCCKEGAADGEKTTITVEACRRRRSYGARRSRRRPGTARGGEYPESGSSIRAHRKNTGRRRSIARAPKAIGIDTSLHLSDLTSLTEFDEKAKPRRHASEILVADLPGDAALAEQ